MVEMDLNWQLNKSLIQCNKYMLQNEIATDVNFVFKNRKTTGTYDSSSTIQQFKAHKYMLMSRSPVFYAMFCGDMPEKGDIVISDDVQPEAFQQMLNYIYTDQVTVTSELVMFIIYLSKMYILPGLTSRCTKYLHENLSADNVCTVLEQSLFFDEQETVEKCMKLIKYKTRHVFNTNAFLEIQHFTLNRILDSDVFDVKEIDVFNACLNWAKHRCHVISILTSCSNMQDILKDCLLKIRFSEMDYKYFTDVIQPADVLTTEHENMLIKSWVKVDDTNVISRYDPSPFTTITTDTISPISMGTVSVKVDLLSEDDINLHSLIIGTWHGTSTGSLKLYGHCFNSYTSLVVVECNDIKIFGKMCYRIEENKQEWKLDTPTVLKQGKTTFTLYYHNSGTAMHGVNAVANVHVVYKREIVCEDRHAKFVIKAHNGRLQYRSYIPLLGIKYSFL